MEVAIEHVQILVQACAERLRVRAAVRIAPLAGPAAHRCSNAGTFGLVQVLRLYCGGRGLQHRILGRACCRQQRTQHPRNRHDPTPH
ncbi:hypothetical protein G6F65_017620 [Rhizopus arrhizus]|uniref:Uncharacterized protein n=1 Tax=Rhizopus delemar TaxID=936053 RepID=A0A9P7CC15_9FUNG|nr:hypothetical protein G6F65_017620 [Rhizopus arrhizus]KAG1546469.1 hypothetical protein G6F50_013637 [Rhizopus delemar]